MNSTRVTPSGLNTFLIRVDGTTNGDVQGVVDGVALEVPIKFSSFMNLVFQLENALDQCEASVSSDNITISKVVENFEPNIELEILFRQNHSWQGKVTLLDQKKEATFRSVLELMIFFCTMYES